MDVIKHATYGTVLRSSSFVYYVPTKTPSKSVQWPATTEEYTDLKRSSVASVDASAGETTSLTVGELRQIDGVIPFHGASNRATSRALNWAQMEELVGPLRYRSDVESAAMYWIAGDERPRIPLRVAAHGPGAIGVYLSAYGHSPWAVAKALGLTYPELLEHKRRDVYKKTPSFDWEENKYE